MDYTNFANYAAMLFAIIGVLVVLTNIIVEVFKKITWNKLPTELVVFVVAIALTVLAFLAWASYTAFAMRWYYIVSSVIVGIMVAYAAMFGFEKLKTLFTQLQNKE